MFARFIGAALLLSGSALALSKIDPMAFCFKQCDSTRTLVALFGDAAVRIGTGLLLAAIGVAFLLGSRQSKPKTKNHE